MTIFTHTDSGGDETSFVAAHPDGHYPGGIAIRNTSFNGRSADVALSKDELLRLYNALGEYLYPVHTPEGDNRSLIEQLIDKAVKDAVTAILPLHLAPAGDRWGYVDANRPPFDFDDEEAPELCNIPGCMITGMPGTHFAHDPIPTACGDAGEHRPQDCPEYDSATEAKQTALAKWEAELRRDAGRSLAVPYCDDCGHSRIRHDSGRCSVRRCLCNWDGKP